MPNCSQYPLGSQERIRCAAETQGLLPGSNILGGIFSNSATMKRAGQWWYIIIAIILIAAVIDYNPVLGGWMLLFAVVTIALVNKQGFAIVTDPSDRPVSNMR